MVILRTLLEIAAILLNVLWWLIIIQVILSWLVAFNVINTRNQFVWTIGQSIRQCDCQAVALAGGAT